MKQLTDLYTQWKGEAPVKVEQLPGAGSNRQYFRMTGADGEHVIGVVGTSRDEDHAFIYLTRHFTKRRLPVPRHRYSDAHNVSRRTRLTLLHRADAERNSRCDSSHWRRG